MDYSALNCSRPGLCLDPQDAADHEQGEEENEGDHHYGENYVYAPLDWAEFSDALLKGFSIGDTLEPCRVYRALQVGSQPVKARARGDYQQPQFDVTKGETEESHGPQPYEPYPATTQRGSLEDHVELEAFRLLGFAFFHFVFRIMAAGLQLPAHVC
mgnify:CR=1 FL=1